MIKTYLGNIQLPVNPLNEVTFSTSAREDAYDIISFGEYIKLGNLKSTEVEIESIFTDKEYPFAPFSGNSASGYVSSIKGYMNKNSPVRLIIAGDGVNINMLCVITGFKYSIRAGEEAEIYYKLALKEYKEPVAKKVVFAEGSDAFIHSTITRAEKEINDTTHIVQEGDTAWSISKTYYGSGDEAEVIKSTNPTVFYQSKPPVDSVVMLPKPNAVPSIGAPLTFGQPQIYNSSMTNKQTGISAVDSVSSLVENSISGLFPHEGSRSF